MPNNFTHPPFHASLPKCLRGAALLAILSGVLVTLVLSGALALIAGTGMIEDVNPYLIKMLGYSREEFVEKKLWEVGAFRDIESSKEAFEALQENEYIRYEDLPLKTKDGRLVQVEFVGNVYFVDKEKVIQCNIRDVTDRKQVEAAREHSEALFRALFELSPDAIIILDPHDPNTWWPIIDCNAAACRMNGYRRNELIGHSIDILNAAPFTPAGRNAYMEQLREAGNFKLETHHRHKNGVVFPIEVSTSIITVDGRELIMGIDRDITGRKREECAFDRQMGGGGWLQDRRDQLR